MNYTVWYGESREQAEYIVDLAGLGRLGPTVRPVLGNRREFVDNPVALQQILYLDRPDVIVTQGEPERPVLAVEFCAEAPSGHNICQRLARVAAAAEFGTPFAFVFPRRKWIVRHARSGASGRWDEYNPLPLRAMEEIARFHHAPVAAFFWDADDKKGRKEDGFLLCDQASPNLPARDQSEMHAFAEFVSLVIDSADKRLPVSELAFHPVWLERLREMQKGYWTRVGDQARRWSPLSDTQEVATPRRLVSYVRRATGLRVKLPEHMVNRKESIVYSPEVRTFRADPYAGNLVAIDYHECRTGPTPRHRHRNLVLHLPNVAFEEAARKFERYYKHECPLRPGAYDRADRYLTLHLRDGCRYTKQKELRVFCYLADMVIFGDAVLF